MEIYYDKQYIYSRLKGGESMSFIAITSITDAEAEAKTVVAHAEAKAHQMVTDAENAGKAAIEAAGAKAESELVELRRQADEKAVEAANVLSKELENTKSALKAKAEVRLTQAASLVVERIVNS